MTRPQARRHPVLGTVTAALLLSSCGLPGDGTLRTIDDDTVPYRLLESDPPSSAGTDGSAVRVTEPLVFWLLEEDRLTPAAADVPCTDPSEVVVEHLLSELAAGPSDDARDGGRSTAIPPESGLALVDITEGTARVEVDPETAISADRLPAAVGQVVLTVTSAPGVHSVTLVSQARPVQVPLPGGALTDGPVTAEDYADLVPDRFREPGDVGCPEN